MVLVSSFVDYTLEIRKKPQRAKHCRKIAFHRFNLRQHSLSGAGAWHRIQTDPSWYGNADEATKIEIEKEVAEDMMQRFFVTLSKGDLRYVVDEKQPLFGRRTPYGFSMLPASHSCPWRVEKDEFGSSKVHCL